MATYENIGNNNTHFEIQNQAFGYTKHCSQWRVIRDCVEGSDAIKLAGSKYLPMMSCRDSVEARMRYEAFKNRAVFVGFLGQTLEIEHGMIFRRCPTINANDNFLNSGLLSNVDRKGSSLYQFASDTTYDVMQTGFGGYLLDMPSAPDGLSVADAEKMGIRPYIKYYPAEDITFWRYADYNGSERLSLVVLHEMVDVSTSKFSHDMIDRYRVLEFDDEGYYIQTIHTAEYTTDAEGNKHLKGFLEESFPIIVQGKRINYLPFVFLPYGEPEKPMFYDLALLNIAHYQATADYKNGVHMTTIPTGYITGYTPRNSKDEEGDEITLGGDIFLTEENSDAKFGTLVFSGEGLTHAEKDIDKIEAQMAGIFIKDIAPDKKTSETAESAYVHRAGENAKLATFARNMSIKLTQIIQWFQEWNNYDVDAVVQLNYDYETMSLDPNIINSIANISGQGKFPLYCVFWILKQQELIEPDMDYDDFIFLVDMEKMETLSAKEIYEAFKSKRQNEHRSVHIE